MLGAHLPERPISTCPAELDRAFDLIVFDWDGTAVESRREDATEIRELIEGLLRRGVSVAIVTGTNLENLDRQILQEIRGPQRRCLRVSTNRGSEGWAFEPRAPIPRMRRVATKEEERALSQAAIAVAKALRDSHGLEVSVIFDRMNRRKIDLLPEEAFADPPKSELGWLTEAVEDRLHRAGLTGGLRQVVELARRTAREQGLVDPRVTTDAKHVEIGLTDKGDALRWVLEEASGDGGPRLDRVLVVGDELGSVGGVPGSDSLMMIPEASGATFVSVGPEPHGVPEGVLRLGGGPVVFRALLSRQLDLRDARRAPVPTAPRVELPLRPSVDSRVRIVERGFELSREHEIEALFTVANGHAGVRGSLAEGSSLSAPAMLVAGLFAPSLMTEIPQLVVAPDAMRLRISVEGHELSLQRLGGRNLRVLDLRQGALFRDWTPTTEDGRTTRIRELRLASLAERDLVLQALAILPENHSGTMQLELATATPILEAPPGSTPTAPLEIVRFESPSPGVVLLELAARGANSPLALAISTAVTSERGERLSPRVERTADAVIERFTVPLEIGRVVRLSRVICFQTLRDAEAPFEAARDRIRQHEEPTSAHEIALRHRAAWDERWATSDIVIEGDPDLERALRFACYHLISAADPDDSRISIGARGLTGTAYAGHVFWDADIFMLPFFALTHPESARALLGYRHATLPKARERARALGYRGALFAWESALSGEDVTPRYALSPDGEVQAIRSGELQHHISADVAHAAWTHWQATGDDGFLLDIGAELFVETARFWASRGQLEADDRFHIRNVIGPDEYHVAIDDNAFTNGLARFNLSRAADVADLLRHRLGPRGKQVIEALAIDDAEVARWRSLARAMYLGLDPRTKIIEQFRGYFDLEDVDLRALQRDPSVPIDVVLGSKRVASAKITKQADVLMLFHLLDDEFPRDVALANFRYYEPRTAHGSSLSPGIHAAVAARLGDLELAERYLRETAAIDLDDRMGNAASGVHLAALGSLWQATLFGCAGVSLREDGIQLDPHLLPSFRAMSFSLLFRGTTLRLRIEREPPRIEARAFGERSVRIGVREGPSATLEPGQSLSIEKNLGRWSPWERT